MNLAAAASGEFPKVGAPSTHGGGLTATSGAGWAKVMILTWSHRRSRSWSSWRMQALPGPTGENKPRPGMTGWWPCRVIGDHQKHSELVGNIWSLRRMVFVSKCNFSFNESYLCFWVRESSHVMIFLMSFHLVQMLQVLEYPPFGDQIRNEPTDKFLDQFFGGPVHPATEIHHRVWGIWCFGYVPSSPSDRKEPIKVESETVQETKPERLGGKSLGWQAESWWVQLISGMMWRALENMWGCKKGILDSSELQRFCVFEMVCLPINIYIYTTLFGEVWLYSKFWAPQKQKLFP